MKVTLFMAASMNSIIADDEGSEDFLSDESWGAFCGLAKAAGCVIVGRKTYEAVMKWQDYSFDSVDARKIVVSKHSSIRLGDGYIRAVSPGDALEKAKSFGHTRAILAGGSRLNTSFMEAGLIDEIILNIEPAALGRGIRLFSEGEFHRILELVSVRKFPSGIVQLRYRTKNKK